MFESDIIVLLIVLAWFIFIFDTIMARRKFTSYNEDGKREKGCLMNTNTFGKNVLTAVLCVITVCYCNLIYRLGEQDGAERVTNYVKEKVNEMIEEHKMK